MSIAQRYAHILKQLPPGVKLVAVSKFQPREYLMEAYHAGARCFGENRPQEFATKTALMPADVEWHFIGHLQTNKVKLVVGHAALLQSVDSLRLLQAVEKWAARLGRVQDVLIQIHIAEEETKQGFSPEELPAIWELSLAHVRICGLMGMATLTQDSERVRREFRSLRLLFEALRQGPCAGNAAFREISMGMSGDYSIAVEEGATIIRVGSAIFPPRPQTL